MRKMIRVPYNGPINAKSGVYGPIVTPYAEELRTIQAMLISGITVIEILSDGKELALSLSNFNKDNNEKEELDSQTPVPPAASAPVTVVPPATSAPVTVDPPATATTENDNQNDGKEPSSEGSDTGNTDGAGSEGGNTDGAGSGEKSDGTDVSKDTVAPVVETTTNAVQGNKQQQQGQGNSRKDREREKNQEKGKQHDISADNK